MSESRQLTSEKELKERLSWLITLRWFAVAGVFLIVTGTKYVLKINVPLLPLYLGNAVLLFYNILFSYHNRHLESQKYIIKWTDKANQFANFQISLDLIMLTYLIHFSGGIENPFIFYFIFHMVIASILLSNRAAYLQVTLAVTLIGAISLAEYLNIIPHYHLIRFIQEGQSSNVNYIAGIIFVLATTLYLTVFMATSIVNKLRAREKELAIVNEKLKEQDRLKSQYVLTVSHDLQTSLSTIQSCLKVVLSDLTGSISEKSREMIARAERRSRYVLKFVKDLLNLSKIRAAKELERRPASFYEIAEKVIEQLKQKANEKRLSISMESPGDVSVAFGNTDAWEQLMVNLVGNAVKYTPAGGNIGIKITEKPDYIQVTVWDTGIGIPKEDLPNIFKDFYRAKNAELMENNGTGLGLSIARQIVKAHRGKIWCESQIGKGTKFIFTLPKGGTK